MGKFQANDLLLPKRDGMRNEVITFHMKLPKHSIKANDDFLCENNAIFISVI